MAQRFLALDWDQQQLHLVAASVRGGSVRFERAVLLATPGSPNPAEAETLGRLLRDRLKEAKIAPAPVLACVGRDRLILKEVRYPAVPVHEEPAVVRFQAIKELTDAADDVVMDYHTLPGGATERKAQVLIIRRELLNSYQALCQAAGLKLAGLAPRPFGAAACLRRLIGTSVLVPPPEPADAAVALVVVGERWAEFCIYRGPVLLQTRSLAVGPNLAGEIRRNLAVHSGQFQQHPVAALYLALSGDQAALREKLVGSLDIPVHPLDPFAGAEGPELPSSGRGTFVGAVGLLHLQAQAPDLPVNFARVKQPRAPRDPNQRVHVLAACLVLAVMGAGALLGMNALSKKRAELADKEQEVKDLTDHLTKERENAKLMLALHEWEGVPWPDELVELSARMPPISNSFKVRLAKGEVLKPQAPKGRPGQVVARPDAETLNRTDAAKFHLALDAPNDEPLRDLTLALQAVDGKLGMVYYRPMPHNESNKVFTKDIYIRKRPPEEYRREVP